MKFRDPLALLLLLPIVLVLARAWLAMRGGAYSARMAAPWKKLWSPGGLTMPVSPRFWPLLMFGIAGALFVLAMARPQSSFQKIKKSIEGIDIVVVLDLSASMRIEDFRDRNRLDTAKPIIEEFIRGRPNDKVGFQTFSGEAVTLVPPTLDHALVLDSLRNAEIGDLKDGTAIGDSLATAVSRLKDSRSKSRIIVLLTDGDSNVGSVDPLTAGELAKGYGIKVYSIAMGRDGRVAMPFVQKDGFGRQFKTYQYFDSSINPELLKQISTATSGKFYRVQDDAKVLREVFADIDQLEKTKIESTEQVKYDERFASFVWVAVVALIFGVLLQNLMMRVYP